MTRAGSEDRRRPGPGPLRLPARARPVAGELLVVRRRILLYLHPDRRLPDVLPGLRRRRACLRLDLAGRLSGPVQRGARLRRARRPLSPLRRRLPVVQADWLAWPGLDGRLGLPRLRRHLAGLGGARPPGHAAPAHTGLPGDRRWRQSRPIAPGTPSSWAAC